MITPNLGRLTTVQPRDVWVHDEHHFTPWLLANVDVLPVTDAPTLKGDSPCFSDDRSPFPMVLKAD